MMGRYKDTSDGAINKFSDDEIVFESSSEVVQFISRFNKHSVPNLCALRDNNYVNCMVGRQVI